MKPIALNATDARYPARLVKAFGSMPQLSAFGNLNLLALPKTALFCSARCPGQAILAAYDQAARWRDAGRCIISGFHSPVEKECLRILLRGSQPVIICPARSLEKMRLPADWKNLWPMAGS
jgi:predicted Rossmann fold nucleotide-binding protein DprA/Smf involved in DNA uptake